MKWIKSPPELVSRFDAAAPKGGAVVRKPIFGYPALYLNGTMFAGTYQDIVVVRLTTEDRAKAARQIGALPFEPMPGRPMREYVVLPRNWRQEPARAQRWVERSLAWVTTLPPKLAKGKAKGKATKGKATKGKARKVSPAKRERGTS